MTDTTIAVGIAGVTGYLGLEAARLLARHPRFEVVAASSDAQAGKRLEEVDLSLGGCGEAMVVGHNDAVTAAHKLGGQLLLTALDPARSATIAADARKKGLRVIDCSGAFAVRDPVAYAMASGFEQPFPELASEAVYGLTEWAEPKALAGANLVANPSAYATATLLPLLPLVQRGLIEPSSLIVDAKQGTTGAGRSAKVPLLHSEIYGNFRADGIGYQSEIPEILQALGGVASRPVTMTFVSHLLPVARGILVTIYLRVPGIDDPRAGAKACLTALREAYQAHEFVSVERHVGDIQLRGAMGTNRCVMSASADEVGGRVVVAATLDNLVKGGAGQAVQNANLMFGLPAASGLAAASWAAP